MLGSLDDLDALVVRADVARDVADPRFLLRAYACPVSLTRPRRRKGTTTPCGCTSRCPLSPAWSGELYWRFVAGLCPFGFAGGIFCCSGGRRKGPINFEAVVVEGEVMVVMVVLVVTAVLMLVMAVVRWWGVRWWCWWLSSVLLGAVAVVAASIV